MSRYSFEIIRRGLDRFSWVFVEVCDGRRRVLARADRDFRKKKRAKKAACALQEAVADAEIIDATGDEDSFDLPATSFEIAPVRAAAAGRTAADQARRGRWRAAAGSLAGARRSADDRRAWSRSPTRGAPAGSTPAPIVAAATEAAARAAAPRAARGRTVEKAGRRPPAARARADR